ncbi:MAG: two-component system, LytT family, response regulator [Bacteroidetes bacterium]|nr:MAG: two-component system, LytT family, response regulator [Bacteroidota bacterium]
MLKALLIDDEKNARTALRKMLEQFCPEVTVIGEAQTAVEGIRLIRQEEPDLLFLDVEMPGGTGFDLLEILDEKRFTTIFTTAHEQYTLPALRSGAVDYLLKPISLDELRAAIKRAFAVKEKYKGTWKEDLRVSISNSDGTSFVSETDIVCIEGDGRYSRFYLTDGKEHVVSKNLGELETELSHAKFFRVHKSWLVNCGHVMRISSGDGGFAVLSNGKEIEISRRKKAEFMQMMEE